MIENNSHARDVSLSITDSCGRQISLLNSDSPVTDKKTPAPLISTQSCSSSPLSADGRYTWAYQQSKDPPLNQQQQQTRRKYHCTEPGCNKSFTTSGHLARHNRIHTGEKNFPCLFPGCKSRFSRQDNMMQHYRTHMSPKSRRSQKRTAAAAVADEEVRPRPKLHAHHRIRSDPVGLNPPLTIDQHLNNYHQSLRNPSETFSPVRYERRSRSPSSTSASSTASSSLSAVTTVVDTSSPSNTEQQLQQSTPPKAPPCVTFYQHRPLTFSTDKITGSSIALLGTASGETRFPFTLLHPTCLEDTGQKTNDSQRQNKNDDTNNGLLQLAHIVSTFG